MCCCSQDPFSEQKTATMTQLFFAKNVIVRMRHGESQRFTKLSVFVPNAENGKATLPRNEDVSKVSCVYSISHHNNMNNHHLAAFISFFYVHKS